MASDESGNTVSTGGGDRQSLAGNRLVRKADPLLGSVFAERYTILEVLGRGGMGVVYKARHDLMDRLVAIKMMLPQLVSDEVSLARFQREARAASKINHPNVIAIHDFGITADNGVPYLVMDYIEGRTLADVIKSETQLGVARTVRIFLQVCDALQHAHRLGVIHRDLKPGNIMLVNHSESQDFAKVVDFGVAKMASSENDTDQQKLTSTGEIFGSPIYMSPEQCGGDSLDARSDIYALGCVLYETLTGKAPCVGKNALETIARHISATPPPFNTARPDLYIPEWIEKIVFKALEKNRDNRQQSMQELFEELYAGLSATSTPSQMKLMPPSLRSKSGSLPVAASATSVAATQVAPAKPLAAGGQKSTLWMGAGVGFLAAAIAFGAFIWYTQQHSAKTPSAQQNKGGGQSHASDRQDKSTVTTKPAVTPAQATASAQATAPTVAPAATPATAPTTESLAKPTQTTAPTVATIKHKTESAAAKTHSSASKTAKTTPAASEAIEPLAPRHHRGGDFYDYAVRKEGEGMPVDIPSGKPFGNQ